MQTCMMRYRNGIRLLRFTVGVLLFGLVVCPAQAAFTSIYIFGDTVSTTTNNTSPYPSATNFFGRRYTNGRVWVEVLAQERADQQLLVLHQQSYSVSYTNLTSLTTNWSYSSNNWSYFDDYSSDLVKNVGNFKAPTNATNALFVVWVNDADFVS